MRSAPSSAEIEMFQIRGQGTDAGNMLRLGGQNPGGGGDDRGSCEQTGGPAVRGNTDVLEDAAKLQEFEIRAEAKSKSVQIDIWLGDRLRPQGGQSSATWARSSLPISAASWADRLVVAFPLK